MVIQDAIKVLFGSQAPPQNIETSLTTRKITTEAASNEKRRNANQTEPLGNPAFEIDPLVCCHVLRAELDHKPQKNRNIKGKQCSNPNRRRPGIQQVRGRGRLIRDRPCMR